MLSASSLGSVALLSTVAILQSTSLQTGAAASSADPYQAVHWVEGGPFHWTSCFNSTAPDQAKFRCGYLDVPLDHTNKSDTRTARIATVLLQAGRSKSNRTVLFNPGGPGESGTGDLFEEADELVQYVNGTGADILAFDPRGTYNKALMQACRDRLGDLPRFVNTVAVAKDMDLIREALGEEETDALVFSYGTDLFITYSQLFPNRVGRVVLQAITDQPHQAKLDLLGIENSADVNDVFYKGFITNCVRVGPSRCPFANAVATVKKTDAASALNQTYWDLIHRLETNPFAAASSTFGPALITSQVALLFTYGSLYDTDDFPVLGQVLDDLNNGNGTSIIDEFIGGVYRDFMQGNKGVQGWPGVEVQKTTGYDATLLTTCADAAEHIQRDYQWWRNLSMTLYSQSRLGASANFDYIFACRHFDWDVTEVLTGPLNARLKHPMLLIGSAYDPTTPYFSAERMLDQLGQGNARLVQAHGFGHGAQLPNTCVIQLANAVFANGTLPSAAHTDCHPDTLPFDS
ncbi:unnamed protein product [Tilletia laevis]|uniref:AB hydrolase-1 domain-containing protein n=1 Tax=Tilletia laevis TaxID=157183 RepID=A0A9N8M5T4_9BASI|nr:unnamed protein product [Tilletia caries]CAD6955140.1 unnamed protein product [Tilletia laevis]CAD6955742.1 unnamed protein product [Tilletia laevis]CAD7065130.1 unnamed protein product [Tilletia caries]